MNLDGGKTNIRCIQLQIGLKLETKLADSEENFIKLQELWLNSSK